MVVITHRVQGHGRETQEPHYFASVTDGKILLSFVHDGGKSLKTGKAASAELNNGRKYTISADGWTALPSWGDGQTDRADIEAIERLHIAALSVPIHYVGWSLQHAYFV